MLLRRLSSRSSGTLGRIRIRSSHSLYSFFIVPLFSSTSLLPINAFASQQANYSSLETGSNSQSRFFCEAGILTEKNFSSKLNKSFENAGKNWCSRLATQNNQFNMAKDKWLGKSDPSSFSNPEDIRTESIDLQWKLDFNQKSISGSVIHNLKILNSNATELIFDTRDLQVRKVTVEGKDLPFKIGQTVSSFGEPLTIQVGDVVKAVGTENNFKVEIQYSSTEKCTGLQWLDPLQTAGRKHPYVFSQCQAIHARSLMPCQDTPFVKAAYTATVSVPKDLQALMSAVLVGEPDLAGENKVYRFVQKIPIPSYLTAIAVGDIVGKEIGPRSRVWAEKEIVDSAAFEFDATESMIATAEKLFGPYVWGQYDILVLPPSFPYGGMENPCLTFATPTLLAGDKSLVNVIAHEIAHSWTGNLVTNKDWEHFWLNEGFTVFAERKILAALRGENFRQFACIEGWGQLEETVKQLKPDSPLTRLVQDLNGIDPDDAFSSIPYEKGSAFLYFLEQKVGGSTVFEPFLKEYIQNNSYKSIDTNVFKSTFINYFQAAGAADKIADIDWDSWLFTPGMPLVKNDYDRTLSEACTNLKNRWVTWDPSTTNPFQKSDVDNLLSDQIIEFLQELLVAEPLSLAKIQAMDKVYLMSGRTNSEIRFRWIRVCIRAKYSEILPSALKFVNEQGRMKFVRPIYRDLYAWEDVREKTIANYRENAKFMMHVTAKMLLQDLHLSD